MGFYDDMAAIASEVLAEFKQGSATLTRQVDSGTPVDADAPWLGNVKTPQTYDLDAAVSAVTVDQATAKFVDGTTIMASDLTVTCAVPEVIPNMSDTLTLDGVDRAIKKIVVIPAAGTPVAVKIIVAG